jgi:NAD+ kinase
MVVRRVGFVLKREKPEAFAIARELVRWLRDRGLGVVVEPEHAGLAGESVEVVERAGLGERIELLVVLGGDGTLLHGASLVPDGRVPVLGVNLGTLGFLVPFAPSDARSALEAALDGKLEVEDRMRLVVRLWRDGQVTERLGLNDAVISQGSMARLVELAAALDGQRIATYKADGLIISTPTGSTAYNLAAGGPILTPGQSSIAITPICPHTLTHRPLVVPATATITVEVPGAAAGILLTVDGQWAAQLARGDRVEVAASSAPLRLYRSAKPYFEILREKLSWGSRAG